MIGEDEEILCIKLAKDSLPPIKIQWCDSEGHAHGVILNKRKEAKETELLVKKLTESTKLLNVS